VCGDAMRQASAMHVGTDMHDKDEFDTVIRPLSLWQAVVGLHCFAARRNNAQPIVVILEAF